jgi:hypothetical protein
MLTLVTSSERHRLLENSISLETVIVNQSFCIPHANHMYNYMLCPSPLRI